MTDDEIRRAVREAFGDLSFEHGDPVNALPTRDTIRTYRKHDNVDRPSRIDGQAHGLVVHQLTTAWAVQQAQIRKLEAEKNDIVRALRHLADCHAASAERAAGLRSTPQSERRRLASICTQAALLLRRLDKMAPVVIGGRAEPTTSERCESAAKHLLETM